MITLLKGTALLLGVIALLSGCEEVVDAPTSASRPTKPAEPAPLYTEIGADELIERWSVLPNGAVAQMDSDARVAGYRLASATDGFSDLPSHFVFSDARKYGSCVVFTATVTVPGFDDDDNPVDYEVPIHILDCVGEPVEDTTGLTHIARICETYPDFILYIVRAGNAEPKINRVEYDVYQTGKVEKFEYVSVSISTHPSGTKKSWDDFTWSKHVRPYAWDGEPIAVHWAVGVRWPGDDGELQHDLEFGNLIKAAHLRFSIGDDSHGMVKFDDNDRDAYEDHHARCETIGEDQPEGGPSGPGEPSGPQAQSAYSPPS